MYRAREYRSWVKGGGLFTFEVKESQTDLLISAAKNLEKQARESVLNYRKDIEEYIKEDRSFYTSLGPVKADEEAPRIVKAMADAAEKAGVGRWLR